MTRQLGGRFDLGEPLRRTAFGQVRVGTRCFDGLPVAVELLDERWAADPDVRARCHAGEAALRAVSGRHLVGVQEVVVDPAAVGVVRDRVGGTDLPALRAEAGGTVAPREAVSVVVDVLDALSDLHAAGLVHGALRERDVLVDLDVPLRPVTRLTGYGTAALVHGPAVPSVDVLAAGRLLCVLLSGAGTVPEGLPPPLRRLLELLLVEDPRDRPTAAQARDALADLPGLRGLPPLPPADAPTGLAALLAPDSAGPAARGPVPVLEDRPSGATPAPVSPAPSPVDRPAPSWSARPEPTEPPAPRGLLSVRGRLVPPRRRALVVLPLSVALGAGVTAVAAATGPDRQGARAAAAVPSTTVAAYVFPALRRPDGLQVERRWELRQSAGALTLHAATLVRNGPRRAVGAGLDEVVPRSVARDVSAVTFAPTPSTVVAGQPVVRYLARLEPGATTGWRWQAPVPAGTDQARLVELARDAEIARLVWESTRAVTRPLPAAPVAQPSTEPEVAAGAVPEPGRSARPPRLGSVTRPSPSAAAAGPSTGVRATADPGASPGSSPGTGPGSPSPAAEPSASPEPSSPGSG